MDFMRIIALLAVLFFTLPSIVNADDVLNSMKKAEELYEKGNYSQAVSELQLAIGLIKDKQVDRYKLVLPGPPSGWSIEQSQGSRGSGLGLGAGVTVSRTYRGPGDQRVKVEVDVDSPLVLGLAMILANPILMGNNRIVTVNGEKAIEEWDSASGSGKLQIIILNRVVVIVSGSNLRSKDVLYDFGEKIDFNKIKKIIQE